MTISKRQLNKWRKEALKTAQDCPKGSKRKEQAECILKLTQELIDQHLLKENSK